jgi:uncharacterized protein YjbJ (UPF0337 family)/anti-sigma regulatory factor (Ser/Thr protein kinase)
MAAGIEPLSPHSPVRGGRVSARFDAEAQSAAAARRLVTSTLGRWQCDGLADEAALLTSELVANAIRHAHSEIDLRVSRTDSGVRVEVADRDPHPVHPRQPEPSDTGGRGLYLVGAMARDWGVWPSPPGKTVWFELSQVSGGARGVATGSTDPSTKGAAMGGEMDETKGRMKEAAGKLTDDEELQREGKVDRAAGTAKEKMEQMKDKAGDAVDRMKDKAQDRL